MMSLVLKRLNDISSHQYRDSGHAGLVFSLKSVTGYKQSNERWYVILRGKDSQFGVMVSIEI